MTQHSVSEVVRTMAIHPLERIRSAVLDQRHALSEYAYVQRDQLLVITVYEIK